MAEGEDQSGEKSYEPTAQRLADARRKGDVPRSTDVSAAAGFVGLFIAVAAVGPGLIEDSGAVLAGFLSNPDRMMGLILASGGGDLLARAITEALGGAAPLFLLPFLAALLALLAQQAIVVSADKIQPKLSRINPISNAKQKFGLSGLVQFLKNTVKMALVSIAFATYLTIRREEIIGSVRGSGNAVAAMLGEAMVALLAIACVIFSSIGLIDLLWQRYDHTRKLRMTHEQVKEETKRNEGDPQLKQERRQKAHAIATGRAIMDVPKADVVIVNPTHYAVALKWTREQGSAPECVAKGVDNVALRIREVAAEAGVPVHRDPPTARALHETVEVGSEILPEHYRAVAAAIQVAERIRQKARSQPWG